MPQFGPIKRRELIACLRRVGFCGPYTGGRHEFMQPACVSAGREEQRSMQDP